MNKNILLSVFCLLFFTCEVPLERVNPLDGLQIVCLSVFEAENNQARVESQIQTNNKVGVIDYGHCIDQADDIGDLTEFSIDTWDECSSKGELVTEEGAISFEDNFEIFTDLPYQFFTYATVSVMGKEMTIYSDVIKFEIDETFNCINFECVTDPTGNGEFSSLGECNQSGCFDNLTTYACLDEGEGCVVSENSNLILYTDLAECNKECTNTYACNGTNCVVSNDINLVLYDDLYECNKYCGGDKPTKNYSCDNNECKLVPEGTGQYFTEDQCRSEGCGAFACENGNCVDVAPETGEYNSMAECENVDVSQCGWKWRCIDGECVFNQIGYYETENECLNLCDDELPWGCPDGECEQIEGGDSPTRYDCIINCNDQRYICVDTDGDGFGDDCEMCVTIEDIGFVSSSQCSQYCNGTEDSLQFLDEDCVEVDD